MKIILVPIGPDNGILESTLETPPEVPPETNYETTPDDSSKTLWLYEDRWRSSGDVVRKRILSSLGRFRSIFARKCIVRRIDAATAKPFLEQYHSYGYAKCAWFYGLFLRGDDDAIREMDSGEIIDATLVAVSSFSEPRRMIRFIGSDGLSMDSYEWVRYASLPDCRIAGGMGKMLAAFIDEVRPPDIMSYSDLEWSSGDVYKKLGFVKAGYRAPVEFYADTSSWRRIPVGKVGHDRAFKNFNPEGMPRFFNRGSIKWVKTLLP